MSYAVKEMFYTLQGEGARSGRAAVFCRFAGCNLWNGLERSRESAICRFCDTDFVGTNGTGGGVFKTARELAEAVASTWAGPRTAPRYVVCTGGEPLLQLDQPAIDAFHDVGFEIALETNGTLPVPSGIDWVCVSPKGRSSLAAREGNELKFVYPQTDAEPEQFEDLSFDHFFVQPMDGPDRERNTDLAVRFCLEHPRWRLSLQTHKYLGIA